MEIVVMPKLGFNMDEGKLMTWYKQEGDSVKKGEPLFSIETDKTAIDVEATKDGVVRKLLIGEGETVPVTLPIAIVGKADEDIAKAETGALSKLKGKVVKGQISKTPEGPAGAISVASGLDRSTGTMQFGSNTRGAGTTALRDEMRKASGHETPGGNMAKQRSDWEGEAAVGDPAYDFDVFIIGGGTGGYVAAIKAAQLGLRTAIAEKEVFGGVCLNKGCIPTKTFIRSVHVLKEVKDAKHFAVTVADAGNARLDMKKLQKRKKEIVGGLVFGVETLFLKNKVTAIKGEAKIIDRNTIKAGKKTYKAANLILATGSETMVPKDIVKTKKYLTSDDVLNLEKLPKDIVIIGGGVIAVEFAYFMALAGVKVTMAVRSRVLRVLDAEIADMVVEDLEKLGITIYGNAKGLKVTDDGVGFETGEGETFLKTKNVLIAIGRVPVVPADAKKLGLEIVDGAIVTDDCLRTNVTGVYAIGDVNGKTMLAHKASAEGIVAAENIAGRGPDMDYQTIPGIIFTKPEVATVGLTEAEAAAKYGEIRVGRFPMAANGKSRVEGDERGVIKVIAEPKYGEIVGAHLYCLHASDMIAEVCAAMRGEMTAEEIGRTIHPHPTVSEALGEAFEAAYDMPVHC